jgi:hypothetical protein
MNTNTDTVGICEVDYDENDVLSEAEFAELNKVEAQEQVEYQAWLESVNN